MKKAIIILFTLSATLFFIFLFSACEEENGDSIKVTDIDGNEYKTVTIGEQVWMAENLRTTTYNDGEEIPNVTDSYEWINLSKGAYAWYENDYSKANTYGALYNWYTVETCKLCPDGWHVPTDRDWKVLEMHLGMSRREADDVNNRGTNEGSKLAGKGSLWDSGSLTNDSDFSKTGFNAVPGGARKELFVDIGKYCYFWSSSEESSKESFYRYLTKNYSKIGRLSNPKHIGLSVRCIKDD